MATVSATPGHRCGSRALSHDAGYRRKASTGARYRHRPRYGLGMAIEANLHGEDCHLAVRADRYEPTGLSTGDDANWVSGEVEVTVGSLGTFHARLRVSLRTEELERFRDELRSLDSALVGEATLTHLEEQFGAVVKVDETGAKITGFVREHVGAELRFEGVGTDPHFIEQALSEFELLVRAFPVRE